MPKLAEPNAAGARGTPTIIEGVSERLQAVRGRIAAAAVAAGRPATDVRLIAVSKTFPADVLRAAYVAGQRDFGENYVQEAIDKRAQLDDLDICWHFIGPLQSNKTRSIATSFDWVHSVDRGKIAERLSAQRPPELPPLQVCIQVNLGGEATKSGAPPEAVPDLARAILTLPRLRLRGLMAIPEPTDDVQHQRERFGALRRLLDALGLRAQGVDMLSMGMSDDLESAIAEGATLVRVGRAVFGNRQAAIDTA